MNRYNRESELAALCDTDFEYVAFDVWSWDDRTGGPAWQGGGDRCRPIPPVGTG